MVPPMPVGTQGPPKAAASKATTNRFGSFVAIGCLTSILVPFVLLIYLGFFFDPRDTTENPPTPPLHSAWTPSATLAADTQAPPPPPVVSTDAEEHITVYIVEAFDGDTLAALDSEGNEAGVRLYGIDCPEMGQTFGPNATAYTEKLCVNRYVALRLMGTDQAGRHVAVVTLPDGTNLNEHLVEVGMAHWYQEYAGNDKRLAHFQAQAKERHLGLWSMPEPVPPWEFQKAGTKPSARATGRPTTPPTRTGTPATAPPENPPVRGTQTLDRPSQRETVIEMVYVTSSGKKYHRATCHHLDTSRRPLTLQQARGTYGPCQTCNAPK